MAKANRNHRVGLSSGSSTQLLYDDLYMALAIEAEAVSQDRLSVAADMSIHNFPP